MTQTKRDTLVLQVECGAEKPTPKNLCCVEKLLKLKRLRSTKDCNARRKTRRRLRGRRRGWRRKRRKRRLLKRSGQKLSTSHNVLSSLKSQFSCIFVVYLMT